ncbi:MAG: TIR domain-containing protein [Blastomonas sp.]
MPNSQANAKPGANQVRLFVSHHSSKVDVALHVEKALAQHGVSCWIAPRDIDPGEPFDRSVKNAIEESSALLLLFCSRSDQSRHVKRELILGDTAGKAIIPLRLEAVDPQELAYHLADSQWIDWLEQRDGTIRRIAQKAHEFATAAPSTVDNAALVESLTEPVGPVVSREPEQAEMPVEPVTPPPPLPPPAPPPEPVQARPIPKIAGVPQWIWVLGGGFAALLLIMGLVGLISDEVAMDDDVLVEDDAMDDGAQGLLDSGEDEPVSDDEALADATAPDEPEPVVRTSNPSFNCARAGNAAERMICGSDELAVLDRQMVTVYNRVIDAAGADAPYVRQDQMMWLQTVRNACGDEYCLASAMQERTQLLQYALDSAHMDF